jgi:hypothetical protein
LSVAIERELLYTTMYLDVDIMTIILMYNITYKTIYMLVATVH